MGTGRRRAAPFLSPNWAITRRNGYVGVGMCIFVAVHTIACMHMGRPPGKVPERARPHVPDFGSVNLKRRENNFTIVPYCTRYYSSPVNLSVGEIRDWRLSLGVAWPCTGTHVPAHSKQLPCASKVRNSFSMWGQPCRLPVVGQFPILRISSPRLDKLE